LPTILLQLLEGQEEVELGRLDTRRDLTFVSDTVDGFVRAANARGLEGRTVQLGTGRAVSVLELLQIAGRVLGREAKPRHDPGRVRPDTSEVLVLESDPSLARDLLKWAPTVTLEEGIRRTAAWLERDRASYRATFERL
jgi:UDP-glucose 4-epimerase